MSESLAGDEPGWVLAESDLFVLAVAAASDRDDLRRIESLAVPELMGRIRRSTTIGGKRWDAYLVLLSSRRMEEPDDAREFTNIEYDTHGLRRLVASAVDSTEEDIRRVLRPFIPLPPPSGEGLTEAFSELRDQLVLNGICEEEARQFVEAFRDRGHLDDL